MIDDQFPDLKFSSPNIGGVLVGSDDVLYHTCLITSVTILLNYVIILIEGFAIAMLICVKLLKLHSVNYSANNLSYRDLRYFVITL